MRCAARTRENLSGLALSLRRPVHFQPPGGRVTAGQCEGEVNRKTAGVT
nr:MAG TPA_asm: hypothetical protein [Caudoviricetes sp.]